MSTLQRGDVLSYSSGSTNDGPDGFRVVVRAGDTSGSPILDAIVKRWPDMLDVLGGATPPLFINAYPATIGRFEAGVVVDTYLSTKTASRALQLAARESMPVVLMAQPLFAAACLWSHLQAGRAFPSVMLLGVGGYPMPRSLERTLMDWVGSDALHTLFFYGLAEIDAAMLLGRQRNEEGAVIYYPRDDVRAELSAGYMQISRRQGDGRWTSPVNTKDQATNQGEGFVFPYAAGRADAEFLDEIESWGAKEWARRTGYIHKDNGTLFFQLRQGEVPLQEQEVGFWSFGERFGFSWLEKPRWREAKSSS